MNLHDRIEQIARDLNIRVVFSEPPDGCTFGRYMLPLENIAKTGVLVCVEDKRIFWAEMLVLNGHNAQFREIARLGINDILVDLTKFPPEVCTCFYNDEAICALKTDGIKRWLEDDTFFKDTFECSICCDIKTLKGILGCSNCQKRICKECDTSIQDHKCPFCGVEKSRMILLARPA
jgi:hypothetical protein